jgi:hypothetical protein
MSTVILILKVNDKEEAEKRANVWLENPNIKVTGISKTEPNGNYWSLTIHYEETAPQ